jgi:2-methylisocitrate lyase-like PEP mutase family enzyme
MTIDQTPLAMLADRARTLLDLHRPGDPLVLVNAWDVASAGVIEQAGARAIATTSVAIAAVFGEADGDRMDVDLVFDMIRRIARSTELPVTADIEAGYGLDPEALVARLLDAGAVGCNIEDSDHTRPGSLVAASAFAARLAAIRAAADSRGVHLVVNARIDTLLHGVGDPDPIAETIARARLYADAGADCAYPIRLTDPDVVRRLVAETTVPINANLGGNATVADLARAGAARISIGPSAHRAVMARLAEQAASVLRPEGSKSS